MDVVLLRAEDTHGLRRRALYAHWEEADVHYPEDDLAGSFHLGVADDPRARAALQRGAHGALVAVASWYPQACTAVPGRRAYRLRGMAVEPAARGGGVGRLLFQAGTAEVGAREGELVWANARDSALGFYAKLGMRIAGEGFTAAGGLPHHLVLMERSRPGCPGPPRLR